MAFSGSRRRRRLNTLPATSRKIGRIHTHVLAGMWRVDWQLLSYGPPTAASGGKGSRRPASAWTDPSGKTARDYTSSGKKGRPPRPIQSTPPSLFTLPLQRGNTKAQGAGDLACDPYPGPSRHGTVPPGEYTNIMYMVCIRFRFFKRSGFPLWYICILHKFNTHKLFK